MTEGEVMTLLSTLEEEKKQAIANYTQKHQSKVDLLMLNLQNAKTSEAKQAANKALQDYTLKATSEYEQMEDDFNRKIQLAQELNNQYRHALVKMLCDEVLFRLKCRVDEEKKWWWFRRTKASEYLTALQTAVKDSRKTTKELASALRVGVRGLYEHIDNGAYQPLFQSVSRIAIDADFWTPMQGEDAHTYAVPSGSIIDTRYQQLQAILTEKENALRQQFARQAKVEETECFLGLDKDSNYPTATEAKKEEIEHLVLSQKYQSIFNSSGKASPVRSIIVDERAQNSAPVVNVLLQSLSQKVSTAIATLYGYEAMINVSIKQDDLLKQVASKTGRGLFRWPLEYRAVENLLNAAKNPNLSDADRVDVARRICRLKKKFQSDATKNAALQMLQEAFDADRYNAYMPKIQSEFPQTEAQRRFIDSFSHSEERFLGYAQKLATAYSIHSSSNHLIEVMTQINSPKPQQAAQRNKNLNHGSHSAGAGSMSAGSLFVWPTRETKAQELDRTLIDASIFLNKAREYAGKINKSKDNDAALEALAISNFSFYKTAPKSVVLLYTLLTWYIERYHQEANLRAFIKDCFALQMKVASYLENFVTSNADSVARLKVYPLNSNSTIQEMEIQASTDAIDIELTTEGCSESGKYYGTQWTSAGMLSERICHIFPGGRIDFPEIKDPVATSNSSSTNSLDGTPVKASTAVCDTPRAASFDMRAVMNGEDSPEDNHADSNGESSEYDDMPVSRRGYVRRYLPISESPPEDSASNLFGDDLIQASRSASAVSLNASSTQQTASPPSTSWMPRMSFGFASPANKLPKKSNMVNEEQIKARASVVRNKISDIDRRLTKSELDKIEAGACVTLSRFSNPGESEKQANAQELFCILDWYGLNYPCLDVKQHTGMDAPVAEKQNAEYAFVSALKNKVEHYIKQPENELDNIGWIRKDMSYSFTALKSIVDDYISQIQPKDELQLRK